MKNSPKGIGIDLFFGGGADSFLELEHQGALTAVDVDLTILDQIPQSISGIPLYSPERLWFANAISAFGLLYNKTAVARLGLSEPKRWIDLANPDYFDLVGAGDPRKSGSMHAMFEIILQGYGWQEGWSLIQKISRNVRNFSGSASQIGKEVATGEVVYGIAIDTYAGDIIRQVGSDRLEYKIPEDFAALNGDCIAMLKGAPHAPVAKAFIEYTLSEAGQLIWYAKKGSPGGPIRSELGKLSVLPSLYGRAEAATIFKGNPFTLPNILAYDAELAGKRWSLVNDLFGTFIIDLHDRLVQVAEPALLKGIPVSEHEALKLISHNSWASDPTIRTDYLGYWSKKGGEQLPATRSIWKELRWLPGALFTLALLIMVLKRSLPR
jgi:ABC-type Fe3+ transport system substrate-binding protein